MSNLRITAQDLGWSAAEFSVPAQGFIRLGQYWRVKLGLKFEGMLVDGADSHQAYRGRVSQAADDVVRAVRGEQQQASDQASQGVQASVQRELNQNRMADMGQAIVEGSGLEGALHKLIDGWGVAAGSSDEMTEMSAGVVWDEDFCIFEIVCKVKGRIRPGSAPAGLGLQTVHEAKIRVGLSEAGWARLLALVATRVPAAARFAEVLNAFFQPLRNRLAALLARAGLASAPRLTALLGFVGTNANIWMWAITIGFAVRDLSVWICRKCWERGCRRGLAMSYSAAFVRTLFGYEPVFERYTPHILQVQRRAESHARAIIQRGNQLPAQAWIYVSFGGNILQVRNHSDAQTLGERMGLDMGLRDVPDVTYLEELRRYIDAYNGAA